MRLQCGINDIGIRSRESRDRITWIAELADSARIALGEISLAVYNPARTVPKVYISSRIRHLAFTQHRGPGGGIGRHKGLKIPRLHGRAGSSPAPGTIDRQTQQIESVVVAPRFDAKGLTKLV